MHDSCTWLPTAPQLPKRKLEVQAEILATILGEAIIVAAQHEPVSLVAAPKISVILPAYNEEIARREAMKAGGSQHVKVVGYSRDQGKGFAVKYGAEHVSGDLIVFMDSVVRELAGVSP